MKCKQAFMYGPYDLRIEEVELPPLKRDQVLIKLIACGIKAVWTFAPGHLEVPSNILVQYENMATSLAVLSMHLRKQIKDQK